jgi:hypothetical protein
MLANTGGDEITFTPAAKLEPGTKYIFELRGAKDSEDDDFLPYAISFTTSAATD